MREKVRKKMGELSTERLRRTEERQRVWERLRECERNWTGRE